MNEFKEAMSKVVNTVSLLAYNSGQSRDFLKAITISSLISVSVTEKEEEVLFVLKKDSFAGNELVIGKRISINVLSNLQTNIAKYYGGGSISKESELFDQSLLWDNSREVPTLIGAHLVFEAEVQDKIGRKYSDVFLCSISTFHISNESMPLVHYLRRYQSPNPLFLG